ncbi:hypothetical protein OIE74_33900 [Streptomyces sp. NBC_01716]|nr:hypothetical protein [Streptomyces sp. NBC_01716]
MPEDGLAVEAAQTCPAVQAGAGEVHRRVLVAVGAGARTAVRAGAARCRAQGHCVPGNNGRNAGSDREHHAGPSVAGHEGQRELQGALEDFEVGAADPGGLHPDEDLVRAGLLDEDVIQLDHARAPDDGGLCPQ